MDFWRTVLVLFRRWYVALPTFVGGLALAAAAYSLAPATYESGAVLALTSPLTGGTEVSQSKRAPAFTNPLLNFDASLSQTAALLIQQMRSPAVARSLGVQPGSGTQYDVNNGSSNPELLQTGPFIFVTGRGRSPGAAEEVADKVATTVTEILEERQNQLLAPASTHIEVQRVVPVTDGALLTGKPARAAAVSLALAALASLASVYAFESFATRTPRAPRPRGGGTGRPLLPVPPRRRPASATAPRR